MARQEITLNNSITGSFNGGTNNRYNWQPNFKPHVISSLRAIPRVLTTISNVFIRAQGTGVDANKAILYLNTSNHLSNAWESGGSLSMRFQRSDTSQWLDLTNVGNARWRGNLTQAHEFMFSLSPIDADEPYRYEYSSTDAIYTTIDNLVSWFNQIRTDEGTGVHFNTILTLDDNRTIPKIYAGDKLVHSILKDTTLINNVNKGATRL